MGQGCHQLCGIEGGVRKWSRNIIATSERMKTGVNGMIEGYSTVRVYGTGDKNGCGVNDAAS